MTRFGYVIVTLFAAELFGVLFAVVAWLQPQPRLIWNASASAPIGLYRLHHDAPPAIGDMVAIMPPPALARLMAERHYLPVGTPLLKHVGALPGQNVCRRGASVTIDGKPVAIALPHDRRGGPLPVWHGCRTIGVGTLFLLNAPADSFDSRYFGALPASGLLGLAIPILIRNAPGKPLRWRGLGGLPASSSTTKEP